MEKAAREAADFEAESPDGLLSVPAVCRNCCPRIDDPEEALRSTQAHPPPVKMKRRVRRTPSAELSFHWPSASGAVGLKNPNLVRQGSRPLPWIWDWARGVRPMQQNTNNRSLHLRQPLEPRQLWIVFACNRHQPSWNFFLLTHYPLYFDLIPQAPTNTPLIQRLAQRPSLRDQQSIL